METKFHKVRERSYKCAMEKCYNVPCGVGLQFQMSPELMIFNIDRHKFVDRFTIYVP